MYSLYIKLIISFITIVILSSANETKQNFVQKDYFQYVTDIQWNSNNEYFSLVYDSKNDLIWALQSTYIDYIKTKHPKEAITAIKAYKIGNKYYRKLYCKFDTIVYTGDFRTTKSKYFRFKDNNKLAIYYKSINDKSSIKKPFGTLDNLNINGITSSWRIPTYKEIQKNHPFKKYQKYLGVHFSSTFYSPPYGELEQLDFNLPVLITSYYNGYRNGYAWSYKKDKNNLYTIPYRKYFNKMKYDFAIYENNVPFVLPVRKPKKVYDKIIFDTHYSPEKKLSLLTSQLTQNALKVTKKTIQKPQKIPYIKPKELKRGEFEKSSDFAKRVEAYKKEINQKNKEIDKKNDQAIQDYSKALEAEDIRYNRLKKYNSDPKVIAKTANMMAQKAMRMIFGDPKFSDIMYDADNEVFNATLYSSSNKLQMDVKIPVAITKAKQFKTDLLNDKLIPVVNFIIENGQLHFKNVKIISNKAKIEKDLSFAKEFDTPRAYKKFLKEYPNYKEKAKVKKMLQNAIEKKAYHEASSLSKLEQFIKKYPHSKYAKNAKQDMQKIKVQQKREAEAYAKKRSAYNAIKKVGDKVCKDGTTAFILSITITAFVENVNGDNIQLRISDTEGTTPYYNGVKLYSNTLIWDRYNNWYKCN